MDNASTDGSVELVQKKFPQVRMIQHSKPLLPSRIPPPYYRAILTSRSFQGSVVQSLWVDSDRYGFKMTPSTTASD